MEYRYKPQGVCSMEMIIDVDNDTIQSVKIIGGCPGNTVGVSNLVKGMKIDEVIKTNPVVISHKSGHAGIFNTKALENLGITSHTAPISRRKYRNKR